MTTFEAYKKCAKEWYAKNKSEKNCPSDKKLMEWYKDFAMKERHASSKKQRAFMNVVHDMMTGEKEPEGAAGAVAKNMDKDDVEDMAFSSNDEIKDQKKKDQTDEGIGISKTVKKGKNAKTQNYKKRSPDHVREEEFLQENEKYYNAIRDKFGAPPKGADLRNHYGQPYVFYYGDNPEAKAWAMKVKKAFPKGVVYTDTAQMEEGSNLSLANKKGMNAKPQRRKKMNESELRSYIAERLKKLDQLHELDSQKKKLIESLTAEDMKNMFMVIDAEDQSLIGKSFMNPPERTSFIPVRKDDEEAVDLDMAAENYPAGAANDPNAPWNQEEPKMHHGSVSKKKLTQVAGDPAEDFLVQDDNDLYVISRENLNNNTELLQDLQFDYGTVPIEDEEPDYEGGGVNTSYDWDEAVLDTDDLLNAAGDHIIRGDIGSPDEYESGEHFIYRLTPELAERIWSVGSALEQVPQVQQFIDYSKLS